MLFNLIGVVGAVVSINTATLMSIGTYKTSSYKSTSIKPTNSVANSVMTSNVKNQLGSKITYSDNGSFTINNNKTNLNAKVSSMTYVSLSKLDTKGRPQVANALLNRSSRMYADRKSNGNSKTIKPIGWHQVKINNTYVYNRGHLIGYAIAGSIKGFDASEANRQNIISQTAWSNQASNNDSSNAGQNYYESLVRKKLDSYKKTNKNATVRYRVTPVYDGSNIVASGTHMEAKSSDGTLEYNVFVPNVQNGVQINYKTGIAHAN